jgi:hypothetical protein
MRIKSGGDIVFSGANQKISGSSTSTGSFGGVETAGNSRFAGNIAITKDSGGIYFGADGEVSLRHLHNAGLLIDTSKGLFFRDQGGEYIYSAGDGDLRIHSGTKIHLGANVGIGTTSPDGLLEVSSSVSSFQLGTGVSNMQAKFQTTSTHSQPDVFIVDGDNSDSRAALQVQGNAGSAEALFVASSGKVGIGTTAPAQPLHILKASTPHARMAYNGSIYMDIGYNRLEVYGGQVFYIATDSTTRMSIDTSGNVDFPTANAKISGSSTSTGSFGTLVLGMGTGYTSGNKNTDAKLEIYGGITIKSTGIMAYDQNYYVHGYHQFVDTTVGLRHYGYYGQTFGTSAAANAMYISQSGHIGVGTATLYGTSKLQVVGSSTTSLGSPQMIVHGRAVNGYQTIGLGHVEASYQNSPSEIGFLETNNTGGTYGDLIFATRATNSGAPTLRMSITSDGQISGSSSSTGSFGAGYIDNKLGIGTTSPGYKLDVGGDSDTNARVGRTVIGYGAYSDFAWFSHTDRATSGNYALIQGTEGTTFLNSSTGYPINFRINNVDKMTLASTGNFGIGTTTPNSELHVVGDIRATGDVIAENYIVSSSVTYMTQSFSSGSTVFGDSGDDIHQFTGSLHVSGTVANESHIIGTNVGIETTDPEQKLHVMSGSIMVESSAYGQGRLIMMGRTGHQYEWYIDDPGLGQLSLYNRGRGGYDLTFSGGNATFTGTIGSGAITSTAGISGTTGTFTGAISTGTGGSYPANYLRGTTYFYIDADSTLSINNQGGNATGITAGAGDGLYIGANNAAGAIHINTSQQVSFPQNATFAGNVSGSSTSTGSFGTLHGPGVSISSNQNTLFGRNAGANIDGNSTWNTFIGAYSGDASLSSATENTGIGQGTLSGLTTGDYNTAVGTQALEALTTAGQNTAVGQYAGLVATTASGSVFVGAGAGRTVSTGNMNIAIGFDAMYGATTTGDNNIAIGVSAGDGLTSGNRNIFMGKDAGGVLATGVQNIAIGDSALDAADGAEDYNIAIGNNALGTLNNDGAQYNIAIGADSVAGGTAQLLGVVVIGQVAGQSINSADANYTVAVGYAALRNNTSGIGNVAVGYSALNAEDDGDYSTAIGYQALTAQTGVSGNVYNTAVGYQSANSITTGKLNTALGGHSLGSSQDVDRCIAIGYAAINANSTAAADGAVAVGYAALNNLSSGAGNTAVGYQSLKANTSGLRNTALGYEALLTNVDGDANTAIGMDSLKIYEPSDGTGQNTALGYQSGDALTTGYNNTLLGQGTDASAVGAINQTVVGQGATGLQDNSVVLGNTSVTAWLPPDDNGVDLGSASYRFANLYTADVQLSNEGTDGNEVDGTTGNWTIQEGEDDLYLLNRKNGKKYRFKLEEIK